MSSIRNLYVSYIVVAVLFVVAACVAWSLYTPKGAETPAPASSYSRIKGSTFTVTQVNDATCIDYRYASDDRIYSVPEQVESGGFIIKVKGLHFPLTSQQLDDLIYVEDGVGYMNGEQAFSTIFSERLSNGLLSAKISTGQGRNCASPSTAEFWSAEPARANVQHYSLRH